MITERTSRDDKPHLGPGLYIVRTILKHLRGTIEIRNLNNNGVVFTATLPTSG